MPQSPQRSNASASLMVGLAAAVILALGVGVLVYNRQPQASPTAPAAAAPGNAASPAVAPPAPSEPSAAAGNQPPGGAPAAGSAGAAAPRPPSAAPAATGGASSSKGPSGVRPPDRPSPGTPRASAAAPATPPLTPQAMLRRGFIPSRTASENVKGVSKTLSGFDSRKSKGVTVKRAPEVDGRIEFTTTPHRVKPGDKYSLRVSLINEGKRPIEIKEVAVTTALNRKESSATVKPLVKQVSPRQNEVIHEISGIWDKNTTSFTVEVRVMSDRLDVYRNELVWK
jgi:hypothetical protein